MLIVFGVESGCLSGKLVNDAVILPGLTPTNFSGVGIADYRLVLIRMPIADFVDTDPIQFLESWLADPLVDRTDDDRGDGFPRALPQGPLRGVIGPLRESEYCALGTVSVLTLHTRAVESTNLVNQPQFTFYSAFAVSDRRAFGMRDYSLCLSRGAR